jgi:transposase
MAQTGARPSSGAAGARPHDVLTPQRRAGRRDGPEEGERPRGDRQHRPEGVREWRHEKHGGKPRRSWRKLHLAVDPDSGEILASELTTTEEGDASLVSPLLDQIDRPITSVTADGAYDGEPTYRSVADHTPDAVVIIPPRSTAVPSATAETAPTQRDRHIQLIGERGRLGWQRAVDYGRRSLAEVAMFRYKKLIGRNLHARTLPAQRSEAKVACKVACKVINIMTSLGMPVSRRLA